jgi:hypothetical protein
VECRLVIDGALALKPADPQPGMLCGHVIGHPLGIENP